ncbi:SusC/RagA family TonB-linked outer membrane protein [Puia dinghuensis]|uniref:SusC/RagA family TonB-linked outer membrane protein n=2 Tax=Puia dinghuensis TaxID=1792502 RepID=A0A8J2UHX8_9BACT|nr:SusC/RagA family TonB-linked outer membrane protein [Puia dinghuensis]
MWASFLLAVKAQPHTHIDGTVRDEKGNPLYGATISEKNRASNATTSDSAGHFSLELKGTSNQVVVSYVGFDDKTIKVTTGSMAIVLSQAMGNNSDVVVVGYQSQKRRNVTAAVSSISGREIQDVPEASFDEMLQGRLAGVTVQSSQGSPGSKPNIVIRGSTNVDYANSNGGNTGPLYVIDGVIYDVNNIGTATSSPASNPLTFINPNDIESIDVLKDASASAIYGARGGNGVIIVKTKKARRTTKPQVQLSGYMGVTTRPQLRSVETGTLERDIKLRLLENQLGYSELALGAIPQALTDSLNPALNGDVDWQGMLIRKQAIVNNQDLAVAGYFTGNNSYRLALNHYSEQGAVKGFSLERIAPNLNFNLNPVSRLNINANLLMGFEKRNHGAGTDFTNPYIYVTWNFPSSLVNLDPATQNLYNGNSNRYDDDHITTMHVNLQATDTIARDLTLTSSFGYNNYAEQYAYFSPQALNGIANTAYDVNVSNPNYSWENYLTYLKTVGEHHFVFVGGYSAYNAQQYNANSSAAGINVSGIYTLQTVPPGSNLNVATAKETKTTESYYGRLSYDLKGKYLLTGSIRRDASSIYSPSYRWGTFSAVSAGWIASDEPFFSPLKKVVNFLKLRASYGVTGQDPGSWYARYQTLYSDASFLGATTGTIVGNAYSSYPGGTPSTYAGTTVVSPFPYGNNYLNYGTKSSSAVRWEKYPQLDLGGDIDLFNDRVNIAVDWYLKDAIDKYLFQVPAEATTGYLYYSGNLANVRNTGTEISLSTHNMGRKSAFQWNTTFNISFNKNWVTKLPNNNQDLIFGPPWFRKALTLGSPLFSYKVWQVNGVYAKQSDVPVDPATGQVMTWFGTPMQAGDARIKDQNGDYNIDYEDQVSDGHSPLPKFTGGLGNTFLYKGFSLTVFFSFSYGNKILNGSLSDNLNGSANYTSWGALAGMASFSGLLPQFWQKSGDQTTYPRLVYPSTGGGLDPWNISKSYFLEDGGFIKCKQVKLGYAVPPALSKRFGLNNVQFYGMAENLFMLKQAKNIADPELYDPTTGSVNIVYPTSLKFTFGLNLLF